MGHDTRRTEGAARLAELWEGDGVRKAVIDADPIVWAIGCVVKEDPLENALHSVKVKLNNILEAVKCDTHQLYLTGDSNFRRDLTETYKANRKQDKPYWFREIRQYMIDVWGAEVAYHGLEADDACGLNYDSGSDVIVSIDKDLDQLPGYHYNYNREEHYYVTEEEADRFFWDQMLQGDRADNIEGIKGVGPKKASKLLEDVAQEDYECFVGLQYAIHFDSPEELFYLNQKLLRIMKL